MQAIVRWGRVRVTALTSDHSLARLDADRRGGDEQ
ncbi:MAG: hypothetical protein QOJ35_1017 [Solirubrobacteraceae bacterium]|nr:hypothetical protein [Solirubrobacteraceae bacterium]